MLGCRQLVESILEEIASAGPLNWSQGMSTVRRQQSLPKGPMDKVGRHGGVTEGVEISPLRKGRERVKTSSISDDLSTKSRAALLPALREGCAFSETAFSPYSRGCAAVATDFASMILSFSSIYR
jgi:hypothetical protein